MYPEGASTFAPLVDRTFTFIFAVTMGIVALVTILMVVFAFRYRRSRSPRGEDIPSNLPLEVTWVVIPSLLAAAIFFFGWRGYEAMRTVPEGAMVVQVTARQWGWSFEHENGKRSGDLRVPVGKPVKLVMRSLDVIHCLYIPAFRVKEDVVPGMETYLWFQATKVGRYHLFCAEYCGQGHATMNTAVVVLAEDAFQQWLASPVAAAPEGASGAAARGKALFEEKGCSGCHTVDGLHGVGPTLKGIYRHPVRVATGGKERDLIADEPYLRRSILEPGADVVRGFQPVMPSYQGQLSQEELDQLLAYIESLR